MNDIKNINTYVPGEVPTKILLDDWRIVCAWWASLRRGDKFIYSKEQIINLAGMIYKELISRNIVFHPDNMQPSSKELFSIVSKGKISDESNLAPTGSSGEVLGEPIYLEKVLPLFHSFYLSRPAIYLVGGIVTSKSSGTRGDIDILINRKRPENDTQDLSLIFRLYRQIPRDLWNRIHILYNENGLGPFTDFVPLYDSLIERREDTKIVNMEEGSKIEEFNLSNDILRGENQGAKEMAKESSLKGVKPFRFFEMLKGVVGYRTNETYSFEGLQEFIGENEYPLEVDQKFDGFRNQLHRIGDHAEMYSIDGNNLSERFPFIVKEALSLGHDVILDGELTGYTEGYMKGKHLGRADVSAAAHAKSPLPSSNFYLNVFDIVWYDGKDVTNLPLSERRKLLETLHETSHIKIIPMKVAKDKEQLIENVKWASSFLGSEGAMIKSLASTYPLKGMTSHWVKYKKDADIDAEVWKVKDVKGGNTWNYLCIIRTDRGNPIPIGWTYNSKIKAKPGDIIRVAVHNLNEYTDPKTGKVWYNWYEPRVIELREDKDHPDNDLTAHEISQALHSESGEKPIPTDYTGLFKDSEINDLLEDYPDLEDLGSITKLFEDAEELSTISIPSFERSARSNGVFDADPYMTPASESTKWRSVFQFHFRGKSVHIDTRLERPSFLVGWTLDVQKEGEPKENIDTIEKAKAFSQNANNIKDFHYPHQIVAETKAPEPLPWLKYEGINQPGEVGATKENIGVFHIISTPEVEFGTQKPYFHEYFFSGDSSPFDLNGRFVVRLLKNVWKKPGEISPVTGRGSFVWMARFTKDNEPYILSSRAISLGVMPPEGLSWIPKTMRDRAPINLRYWNESNKNKALQMRKDLVAYFKLHKDEDYSAQDLPKKGSYSLSHICWRGPIIIRYGCSRESYHIFLRENSKTFDIELDGNPLELGKVSASLMGFVDDKWRTFEGKVPNLSKMNPDKETPANMDLLEQGSFSLSEDSGDYKILNFTGGAMKGDWILNRTPGSSIWLLKKKSF